MHSPHLSPPLPHTPPSRPPAASMMPLSPATGRNRNADAHVRGHLGRGPQERQGVDQAEEHTSELQSRFDLVCRLLLEKKKKNKKKQKALRHRRERTS